MKKNEKIWEVGKNYFIRTVTMAILGKLEVVDDKELLLSGAAWVADTGRFTQFVVNGELDTLSEIELFPDKVIVGRGSIVDACVWKHELLKNQK